LQAAESLASLYSRAAEVTARESKSFYFATRFFPKEMARSAHAVYWFCRYTDDLVDECSTIEQGRADLERWSSELETALNGQPAAHPVLGPFLDTVRRYDIPAEYPRELIEGMRMDLNRARYRSFEDLRVFCYRVASVVGLMMSRVIGFRGDAPPYAIDLGIAMQLTNILRDIGEDLDRGRIYLPSEEMLDFEYSEAQLARRERSSAFRELMRFQAHRARAFYEAATPGIDMLHPDGRFAVRVASDVYRGILDRIEATDYDVFDRRAVVPAARKYWITARAMAGPIARSFLRHA
jgi:15-cis-phytoene synthase